MHAGFREEERAERAGRRGRRVREGDEREPLGVAAATPAREETEGAAPGGAAGEGGAGLGEGPQRDGELGLEA
ncbi:MAG TPA: hypothetical protein RMH80_01555, partial [Polyangiaceae bacterium LLY-WYZ-15_(1-7)]|nr:hypothetical protein [Polyangiaceae bacterium LLY-WYZ-15_(1-7)]